MELKSNATVLFMVLYQCVGLDETIQKFSNATKTFPCNENYVWLSVLRPFVAAVPAFVAEAKSQFRVDEIFKPSVMRPGLGTPGWRQAMSNYHQGTAAFRAARLRIETFVFSA